MSVQFASTGDLEEKKTTFKELADGVYAYTAEGDPNSGVIIGDDGVLVMDAQATPVQAEKLIDRIRAVTDKPIKYLVLSHYHAVRVMGASAYNAENIIASRETYENIVERGQQDFDSEVGRFPRLFEQVETVPSLTWPTITFQKELSIWLGNREVKLMHLGRSHTKGDIIAWLPEEKICFAGDMVEYGATPYTGDAYLKEWPQTLNRLLSMRPEKMVPGRGEALEDPNQCREAIEGTRNFLEELYRSVEKTRNAGGGLKEAYDKAMQVLAPKFGDWVIFEHCMPFDVSRAYDEASGIDHPRIWTAERDLEMWKKLQQDES